MYCKHCGKEIADDSKFCQYCGGNQETVNSTSKVDSEKSAETKNESKVIEIPTIKTNFSEKTKWIILAYSTWFIFHLYWLLAGDKSGSASEYFQPFSSKMGSSMSYYDITEFIVYIVGVPLAIWGIPMIWKKMKETQSNLPNK